MTKLGEWLLFSVAFASFWAAFYIPIEPLKDADPIVKEFVFWSPLIFILAFGIVSVLIILYRVATFNDCEDAADELKKQIVEARADLRSKGMEL